MRISFNTVVRLGKEVSGDEDKTLSMDLEYMEFILSLEICRLLAEIFLCRGVWDEEWKIFETDDDDDDEAYVILLDGS